MRNIGSSVGTSMVTTVIARRAQFHQTRLVENAIPGNASFDQALHGLTAQLTTFGVSHADAQLHAYARIYRGIQAQAATLAYIDVFWLLAVGALIMFVSSFLLGKNDPHAGGAGAAVH
jgi:DHA2 family multidrug resistance protein